MITQGVEVKEKKGMIEIPTKEGPKKCKLYGFFSWKGAEWIVHQSPEGGTGITVTEKETLMNGVGNNVYSTISSAVGGLKEKVRSMSEKYIRQLIDHYINGTPWPGRSSQPSLLLLLL